MNRRHRQLGSLIVLGILGFALTGCEQKMARQPRYSPLQASNFFVDNRSARPIVEGTVDRSWVDDTALTSGKLSGDGEGVESYSKEFPFRITHEVFERGQERYNIWCAVCHGRLGEGNGTIVKRGYTVPPSFHGETLSRGLAYQGEKIPLREAPVGYYFEVITRGYGAMPAYASEVPLEDRWAIVAYIRALQYSRSYPAEKLSPEEREKLEGEKP